eukprot:Clim_evm5s244 gene=Clim_evmTU5s244
MVSLLSVGKIYRGPKSDHFNGTYFSNTQKPPEFGGGDIVRLVRGDPRTPWPKQPPVVQTKNVSAEITGNGKIRATFINHSSFLLQMDGFNILGDPVYSERCAPFQWIGPSGTKRAHAPGVAREDLPEIDAVIISHDHYDHLDEDSVKYIATHKGRNGQMPLFIVPLGVGKRLASFGIGRYRELDWYQSTRDTDYGQRRAGCAKEQEGLTVWLVECQHRSGRGVFDHMKTLWGSFVVQSEQMKTKLYFTGDTGYSPHFEQQGKTFAPWFMKTVHIDPEEAVIAHKHLGSPFSIGKHFGTFKLTYEGIDQPVIDLKKAMLKHKVPEDRFVAPKPGQAIDIEHPVEVTKRNMGLDDPALFLSSTKYIDCDHEIVKNVLGDIQMSLKEDSGNRTKLAIAIHDYVRDELKFAWGPKFGLYKASEVLENLKQGFCQTKTTVFVALCRAAGIAARPWFVEINGAILEGVPNIPKWLDHSYAEVYLDEEWLSLDSFIVPQGMVRTVKERLRREGKDMGMGIALYGRQEWNGKGDNFIQWIPDARVRRAEYPFFSDVGEFYQHEDRAHNGGAIMKTVFPYIYSQCNGAVLPLQTDD